jgi:predicted phosphodiesterase
MMAIMKLAVISDIHGNLEAFEAVLGKIESAGVDRTVSLGDNIGYGPDPEAVMSLIRRHRIPSVLGNHEIVIKDRRFLKWFNPEVRKHVNLIQAMLSDDSIHAIRQFPRALVIDNLRFVHGCPEESPFLYLFQMGESRMKNCMARMTQDICFAGHTHDLGLKVYDPVHERLEEKPLGKGIHLLEPGFRYIINAGSVGQPRDRNRDAKLLLFDTGSLTLEVQYVPYDYQTTVAKIRRAGFSESFAEKLMKS